MMFQDLSHESVPGSQLGDHSPQRTRGFLPFHFSGFIYFLPVNERAQPVVRSGDERRMMYATFTLHNVKNAMNSSHKQGRRRHSDMISK